MDLKNGFCTATVAAIYRFSAAKYETYEVRQALSLELVSSIAAKEEYSLSVQLKNGSAMCKLHFSVNTGTS